MTMFSLLRRLRTRLSEIEVTRSLARDSLEPLRILSVFYSDEERRPGHCQSLSMVFQ